MDLIEFDLDAIIFGRNNRDNFGETVGGINYSFRYHPGDRVTLISDGYYDLFDEGLKSTSLGAMINRPERGNAYLGLTSLDGPINSTFLVGTLDYRMSEKWIVAGASTLDLKATGNIGQSVFLTRIGESFLFRLGANIDYGRDNVTFVFALEPRFLQTLGMGAVRNGLIPNTGMSGLE